MRMAPPFTAVLFSLSGCLVDFGGRAQTRRQILPEHSELTPGAEKVLQQLNQQAVPCAWLETLPVKTCQKLTKHLPDTLPGFNRCSGRPPPAPDAIWQALTTLNTPTLHGCVLVSGHTALLQAGLNAGLWTVGLVACSPLAGHTRPEWEHLGAQQRDQIRSQAILSLYASGIHSAIDLLDELPDCLEDIKLRRQKGEKP